MRTTPLLMIAFALICGCPEPRRAGSATRSRDLVASDPLIGSNVRASRQTTVCVVRNGRLERLAGAFDPQSGDTLVEGRPLRDFHAPGRSPYAAHLEWHLQDQPISFHGRDFVKNAHPLPLPPEEVRRRGEARGVPVFIDARARPQEPSILYVLLAPDCTFQGYYYFEDARS